MNRMPRVLFFGLVAALFVGGIFLIYPAVYAGLCRVVDQDDGISSDSTRSGCLGNGVSPSTSNEPPNLLVTCSTETSEPTGLFPNGPSHLPDGGEFSFGDFNREKAFMETLSQSNIFMVAAFGGKKTCVPLARAISLDALGFHSLSTSTSTPTSTVNVAIEIGKMAKTDGSIGTFTLNEAFAISQYFLQFGLDDSDFDNKIFHVDPTKPDKTYINYRAQPLFDGMTTMGVKIIRKKDPSTVWSFIQTEFTRIDKNVIGNDVSISFKRPDGGYHTMTVYAINTAPNPDGTHNIAFSDTANAEPHYIAGRMESDGTLIIKAENRTRTAIIEERWKMYNVTSVGATAP